MFTADIIIFPLFVGEKYRNFDFFIWYQLQKDTLAGSLTTRTYKTWRTNRCRCLKEDGIECTVMLRMAQYWQQQQTKEKGKYHLKWFNDVWLDFKKSNKINILNCWCWCCYWCYRWWWWCACHSYAVCWTHTTNAWMIECLYGWDGMRWMTALLISQ